MPKHVNAGDSIECNRSRIAIRKISNPTLVDMEDINGVVHRLYKYKSDINSNAIIIEELNPKTCLMCVSSYLDLNEELEATKLEIYTSQRIQTKLISNYSNVHGIQSDDINGFTFAQIIVPFKFILERALKTSA